MTQYISNASPKTMPKLIAPQELDTIAQIVSRSAAGISVEEIGHALTSPLPRRTLQRRLAQLVAEGRLVMEGKGAGSRYRLAPSLVYEVAGPESTRATLRIREEASIVESAAGMEIRRQVRQLIQLRQPVGYNRDLLDRYVPNQSFYLPESTRQYLKKLGMAQGEPQPAGTHALRIYHRLLIDLSWNSSRLEGNTYSLLETERLLALGEGAEGKQAFETQMILNHKAAIELLVESAPEVGFNRYTISNLHALLSENLLPDRFACGRLRVQPVGIGGSVFHPLENVQLIEECFSELLIKAVAIRDPIEQAFFAMVHLPYLQPFDDVNKRVSRLAANIPLIRENFSPLSFVDVPGALYMDAMLGVYELNRVELLADLFVWAYERSCARYSAIRQSLGQPDLFRLHYRDSISALVRQIILAPMNRQDAISLIRQGAAAEVEAEDRSRFVEVVETELMALHEGSMARYRIRPAEFARWRLVWDF